MDDMILMADPNSNSWEFSKKIQNYLNKEKKSLVPLKTVDINYFANKEINMHVRENIRKKDVYFIHDSTKNPQDWWVQLILLKDLLLSASANSVTFVLPDMFYSRKDRKEKPHVPISARALADTISPNLKRIITMDLHVGQIQGFYHSNIPVDNLYSFPNVVDYLKNVNPINIENLVVLSPDAGGVARARAFAQKLGNNIPLGFLYKRRGNSGEIEEMRLSGNVKNLDALLIDDIIDSGNTLVNGAKLLRDEGVNRIYCYGTHGWFTTGTKSLLTYFDRVMTSNTHFNEKDGVEVIDVSPVFAEAIYRAQVGKSISELFE